MGHIDSYDARTASFTRQLGLRSVQLHTPDNLRGEPGYWEYDELKALHDRCTDDGFRVEGIENVPAEHFWKVQRGLPGRDEQLENYGKTIVNMGRAGYTLLGFNFLPTYVWRTEMAASGRGGAHVTAFDGTRARNGNALATYKLARSTEADEPIGSDQMWSNYQYFLDAMLPIAERAGVRLALHPDDPPVDEPLGGVARIFTTPDALVEAAQRAGGSASWGLNFCIGTVSEMGGEDAVNAVIDSLGAQGQIAYIHFRDVKGTVPKFEECFLGEGNLNVPRVLRRLHQSGFDGFIIDDHVPAIIGDAGTWGDTSSEAYCSRGRAHAIGYLQGVLGTLGIDDDEPYRRS